MTPGWDVVGVGRGALGPVQCHTRGKSPGVLGPESFPHFVVT